MVKIHTDAVRHVSQNIRSENQIIDESFGNVERAITTLSRNWQGVAGDRAVRSLKGIKNRYRNDRHQDLERLADFMETRIADVYDDIERKCIAAASEFR